MADSSNLFNPFPSPNLDPNVTMMGLIADIAAMRASTSNTEKRLDRIDQAITKNEDLLKAVMSVQNETTALTKDIVEVKARCETIDRNVDAIGTHELRIKTLETNLIANGELRMSGLEKTRATVMGIICTALVSGVGYFSVTFILPLFKHA